MGDVYVDKTELLERLAWPDYPLPLHEILQRFETDPHWKIDGVATSDGVPGLAADDMVTVLVTSVPGKWRGSVVCQRVGDKAYVVEGMSVVPDHVRPLSDQPKPIWSYCNYRVVSWIQNDGHAHYAVEQHATQAETGAVR